VDIRIYIQGIGVISREQAVTYVATGMVPEDALLAAPMPERALAWYQAAGPAEREKSRRQFGAVCIADFDGEQIKRASAVELFLPVKHSWGTDPATISSGGTSRTVEDALALAGALTIAAGIAREAEAMEPLAAAG
jgi:hypothetical protein